MTLQAKVPNANVGVIIGRFQSPELHEGHKALIDHVSGRHKKVILLLGRTPGVLATRRNPLDFFTRKLMIQAEYPEITILPIMDMPSDKDWSRSVDERIVETCGDHESVVFYGSRDGFAPFYSGRFPTVELNPSHKISASEIREMVSQEVRQHVEFRRGAVYAAYNKHPAVFPTVDIAVIKYQGTKLQIALGRKPNDLPGKWRFPGGFVDPVKDDTIEAAAKRELGEEMGVTVDNLNFIYLGSHKVDDWRYRNEVDKIVTTLFFTKYLWGPLDAGDDLSEAKWFDLDDFQMEILVDGHQPLMDMVLSHLNKEKTNDNHTTST